MCTNKKYLKLTRTLALGLFLTMPHLAAAESNLPPNYDPDGVTRILSSAETILNVKFAQTNDNPTSQVYRYRYGIAPQIERSSYSSNFYVVYLDPYDPSKHMNSSLIFYIDKKDQSWRLINSVTDLLKLVPFDTSEDALRLVRFMNQQDGKLIAKTDYYKGEEIDSADRLCGEAAPSHALWESAHVEKYDGTYLVQRDLMLSGEDGGGMLVRTHEMISREDGYRFEYRIKKKFAQSPARTMCSYSVGFNTDDGSRLTR